MVAKAVISSRELLDILADNVNDPAAKIFVEVRINQRSPQTAADNLQKINEYVALVKEMEATDSDLSHQSARMRQLEQDFLEIKKELLSSMSKKKTGPA